MKPINLNMRDVYRASDVKRWGIVKTLRAQSVAEHSYQVAMIARRLCLGYGLDSDQTARVVWAALVHDLSEVLTGDVPTPTKRLFIGKRLDQFEQRIQFCGEPTCTILNTGQGEAQGVPIERIVKMADVIEAIAFLTLNSCSDHGDEIREQLNRKLHDYGCDVALSVLDETLHAENTTLDKISI